MLDLHPDPARARALDQRMRDRLADSLAYIFEAAEGRLALPGEDERESFLGRLRRDPVAPTVFGAYCDLVLAIEAGQNAVAEALLAEIVAASSAPRLKVQVLADPAEDRVAARYERLIDTDEQRSFKLCAPPAAEAEACAALLRRALEVLDRGHPALADELRGLIREYVLVDTRQEPGASDLSGASSFMLWGAVMLNARIHVDLVDLLAALAHESGHNLLFGLCADGPLVLNEDDERFASPLRSDPRPMDGIVHAVFVVARMHEALSTLLRSGELSEAEAVRARDTLGIEERAFRRGRETVRAQAQLTELGRNVMAGVDAYMEGVLASVA